ncbi:MAG: glycosyltransferase family 4 protein, partial [Myxococcota bacterium]|nr:glycosyltransferase family 4 protein [Myxococcota bacterium]
DPRLHLVVVGEGPMGAAIERLGAELPGSVTWIRGVDHAEVPALVRAMDVAVAPYARLERFYFSPLKVLEYLAAGRAVVASAIGQLPALVRDGETGLLVDPGDARALAGAIRRLADDPALRAGLGARAALDARRHHSWDDRAARILALADARAGGSVAA